MDRDPLQVSGVVGAVHELEKGETGEPVGGAQQQIEAPGLRHFVAMLRRGPAPDQILEAGPALYRHDRLDIGGRAADQDRPARLPLPAHAVPKSAVSRRGSTPALRKAVADRKSTRLNSS